MTARVDLAAVRAIDIGAISISAPTRLAAQRMADALPAAIERALRGGGARPAADQTLADQAAAQIVAAIHATVAS